MSQAASTGGQSYSRGQSRSAQSVLPTTMNRPLLLYERAEGLGLGSYEGEGLPFVPVGGPPLIERQGAQRGERVAGLCALLHTPPLLPAGHTAIIGLLAQPTAVCRPPAV